MATHIKPTIKIWQYFYFFASTFKNPPKSLYVIFFIFWGPNFMNSFFMLNIGTILNFIIFLNYKNEMIKYVKLNIKLF
jgi:hypothetical protein